MLGKNKKIVQKHRFEQPHNHPHSDWRKPQGIYHNDIDAYRRLDKLLSRMILYSRVFSLILVGVLFIGIVSMIFFTNFENVIFDDGSHLFCTVLKDGSVAVAY